MISAANLTFGFLASGTSATTASISPSAGALDIVSVTGGSGNSQVPTVTGAGGTWVRIAGQFDGGGVRGVFLFRDLSPAPGSGALLIDFGGISQNFIGWSINEFTGIDPTGVHGSGAIVQFGGSTVGGTNSGGSVSLAAFASPNNAAFGYSRNNGLNTQIPTAGLFKLSDDANGENAAWGIGQPSVGWTWASQTNVNVILAIEINAAIPAARGTRFYGWG